MSKRRLAVVAGATALVFAPLGTSAKSATRIFDQTFACTILGVGVPDPARLVSVSARPFQPKTSDAPFVGVREAAGVAFTAVTRRSAATGMSGQVSITKTTGTRCTKSKVRLGLSNRGLRRGAADTDIAYYQCDVPAKVLIRVRAVFKRPASFTDDPTSRESSRARVDLSAATIAVATARGQTPIALVSANDATGKAQIFTAPARCTRNP